MENWCGTAAASPAGPTFSSLMTKTSAKTSMICFLPRESSD
jgi:hypothetical protein